METHLLIPATTPSAPPTPALLPTPPLLPTPAHKLTCHYSQPPSPPPLCSSTSPFRPGSTHPLILSPCLCHPPSHPPPSFTIPCRISSGWDSPAIRTTTKGGYHHLAFLKTPRTQGTDKDAHSTHTKFFVQNSSKN